MSQIDVSIIIVNYNQIKLLRNCVASIIRFTQNTSFEIIVVDNASTECDVTSAMKEFGMVTCIQNQSNRGFAAANNQGVEKANGTYIQLLNNDTLFTEDTLQVMLARMSEQEPNTILGCKLLNSDGSHQYSIDDFLTPLNMIGEYLFLAHVFPQSRLLNRYHQNVHPDGLKDVDVVKGAFMFMRTDTFRSLNGFDERFFFYGEETDLCYRLKRTGGIVRFDPSTSIIHFGGATTDSMPWFQMKQQSIAKINYFQKHFSGWMFACAVSIHLVGYAIRIPIFFVNGLIRFNKKELQRSVNYARCLWIYPKNVFRDGQ